MEDKDEKKFEKLGVLRILLPVMDGGVVDHGEDSEIATTRISRGGTGWLGAAALPFPNRLITYP